MASNAFFSYCFTHINQDGVVLKYTSVLNYLNVIKYYVPVRVDSYFISRNIFGIAFNIKI